MRGIGVHCLAYLVLVGSASRLDAQEATSLSLEEVLTRWKRAGAELTTVDVTFVRVDRSPGLIEPQRYQGRLLLKRPHMAFVEFRDEKNGERDHSFAWSDTEFRLSQAKDRQALVFRRPEPGEPAPRGWLEKVCRFQDRSRTPHLPSLPFLFGISLEELRQDYELALLEEKPTGYVLRLTPRKREDRPKEFDYCLVLLDRESFRPTAMQWRGLGSNTTRTFQVRKSHYNEPIEDATFKPDVPEGWKVIR